MTAARDLFRTPDELVLQDRLLSLGCEPWHVAIETHNSGSQSNHFPHGAGSGALPHLLTALRVHRDDAIVGELGPTVCESLWTWAQWAIPREQWAGTTRAGARWCGGPGRIWWPILGDTREDARRFKVALERWANAQHTQKALGYVYSFRGCWLLASTHRASRDVGRGWPWSTLNEADRWPLVFGASRSDFETMRADRAGEGK